MLTINVDSANVPVQQLAYQGSADNEAIHNAFINGCL